MTKTTEEAVAELEAQGVLQPGDEGWWKVWGARPYDIKVGDLVGSNDGDKVVWDLIDATFTAKAAPVRVGLSSDGNQFTIGGGCPVVVLRRGTKNTLADSV